MSSAFHKSHKGLTVKKTVVTNGVVNEVVSAHKVMALNTTTVIMLPIAHTSGKLYNPVIESAPSEDDAPLGVLQLDFIAYSFDHPFPATNWTARHRRMSSFKMKGFIGP